MDIKKDIENLQGLTSIVKGLVKDKKFEEAYEMSDKVFEASDRLIFTLKRLRYNSLFLNKYGTKLPQKPSN